MRRCSCFFCLFIVLCLAIEGCKTFKTGRYRYDDEDEYSPGTIERSRKLFLPTGDYYAVIARHDSALNRAARLLKRKYFKKAHDVLNQMIRKNKNRDGAYFYKAYVYIQEKKYEMAKYWYEKVKENEEYNSAINNNLGVIAILEGSEEEAYYLFNGVLKKSPYYFPSLVNRGFISLNSGLFEQAHEDLSMAVRIENKDENLLMALGIAQRGIGNFEEARDTFTKLSGYPEGLYNLGLVYYEDLQNWKRAARAFKKYLASGFSIKRGDLAETYLKKAEEKMSE